jgi:RNA polymerase sigma-70 factor (ECF subfamily)
MMVMLNALSPTLTHQQQAPAVSVHAGRTDAQHRPTTGPDDEVDLVQRARERSPSAWAKIYDLHYRKLFAYCFARTGDHGAAAALAAEAFLRAVAEIERYDGQPLCAWLYGVVRRVVDASGHVAARSSRAERDDGRACDEAEEELIRVVTHLPSAEREVFVLRYYAGCTSEEVAAALEQQMSAIRRLEARALARVCAFVMRGSRTVHGACRVVQGATTDHSDRR